MSADDTPHSTIHALLDDWGAPKTIHNPFTGTDDPMTVAGRLAEWRAALALAQVPAQRTCPDCGFTASRIGEFHITAQEARGVGPSSDHLALQAQEERPDIDVERLHKAMLDASWPGGVLAGMTRQAAEAVAAEYRALGVGAHDQEPSDG